MLGATVYFLCAFTSLLCTVLLYRQYRHSRSRLLLWSSLCFAGLSVNNATLFIDLVIVPETDLSVMRFATGAVSLLLLLYGMVLDRS